MANPEQNATATDGAVADGLTAREQRFIQAYIVTLNGTKAAIAAGYGPKGARVRAVELLRRPRVQVTIRSIRETADAAAIMSLDEARRRLSKIARGDNAKLTIDAIARLSVLNGWDKAPKGSMTAGGLVAELLKAVNGTTRGALLVEHSRNKATWDDDADDPARPD